MPQWKWTSPTLSSSIVYCVFIVFPYFYNPLSLICWYIRMCEGFSVEFMNILNIDLYIWFPVGLLTGLKLDSYQVSVTLHYSWPPLPPLKSREPRAVIWNKSRCQIASPSWTTQDVLCLCHQGNSPSSLDSSLQFDVAILWSFGFTWNVATEEYVAAESPVLRWQLGRPPYWPCF